MTDNATYSRMTLTDTPRAATIALAIAKPALTVAGALVVVNLKGLEPT